jgi:long-chain-fatty-acid--CoA ligase ACSBG
LAFARKFIAEPVKEALGFDRCKIFFTGSAPTSQETKKFYMSLEMALLDAYGMTESIVHTLQSLHSIGQFGNIGKALPGTETKIFNKNEAGEGEICMKGRHICMGYLNDPEKTKKAIDDEGWLHSGDIGFLDDDGNLFMRGRIKELIITAGGENIPTTLIENSVKKFCPAISNAFLVGDNRKFLTMLLTFKTEMNSDGTPKEELATESLIWLKSKNLNQKTLSELLKDENLSQALQEVIDEVNSHAISNAQKIQKFSVLPHDFSMPTGELTPTLKVKRNIVVEKYKEVIEELYKSESFEGN